MRIHLAQIAIVGLLVAGSAEAAFTVYLKDGSTLQARQPYTVDGDTAVIVLENGTSAALPLAEIDVERTRRSNEGGLAGTKVLRDGRFVEMEEAAPPPPQRETLGSMISTGRAVASASEPDAPGAGAGRTGEEAAAGEPARRPYSDEALTRAIREAFTELQVEQVEVLQGADGAPLLEVVADSEAAVFRGLRVAARVLGAVLAARPGQVPAFDLHFTTSQGQQAGTFRMTPDQADALDQRRLDPSEYYVRYVQF